MYCPSKVSLHVPFTTPPVIRRITTLTFSSRFRRQWRTLDDEILTKHCPSLANQPTQDTFSVCSRSMLTPIVMGRFLTRGNMVLVRNLRSCLSGVPLLIPGCPWLSCEGVDGLDRCRKLLGIQLPRRQSSFTARERLPQMSRGLRCKGQKNLLRYRQPELVLVYRILYITSIRPDANSDVPGFSACYDSVFNIILQITIRFR